MSKDRQIAACNPTIICQRKQFLLESCQVWVFYNHRRTVIISLLILMKPGKCDQMSQSSQTHILSFFLVKVSDSRHSATLLRLIAQPACSLLCMS